MLCWERIQLLVPAVYHVSFKLILKNKIKINLRQSANPITGIRCWVSGWTNPSTKKQDVLRKVDLPLVDNPTCEGLLRKTVLGPKFILDPVSFICAGGEKGKGKRII